MDYKRGLDRKCIVLVICVWANLACMAVIYNEGSMLMYYGNVLGAAACCAAAVHNRWAIRQFT